ncbi:SDR family oxidoreductase [Actinomadura atramentaria]|uniref:SDR family oxidoreductase n=1 Tax=Actinomadura atramentaria TaxID=1990 RepID=UPI00036DE568|nr:SDR family oxidoreductase [Actinomadura atramentaria]
MSDSAQRRCLVTGATGYIGGRLVPELLDAGYDVRCMVRRPEAAAAHPWADRVEIVRGDVLDPATLPAALDGVDVAYYLIHAMGSAGDFAERDRRAAAAFAEAAERAGVGRIVYLGGMRSGGVLSRHLRSRAEVARILLGSGVPTAVLRAGVIIGSGSASFEMLRYLTERLPAMVTPRWVTSRVQPIAIRDVLRYLVGAADLPPDVNRGFDIAGPDVLTYREMMLRYAHAAGLPPRVIVRVPLLSPWLSSLWVGLITPVPGQIARPLVESLTSEVVADEHDIARYVPDPPDGLMGFEESVRLALRRVRSGDVSTWWGSAATPGAPSDPLPTDPDWAGGSLYVDERERSTPAPAAAVWHVIEGVGGRNGWYSLPVAWRLRGAVDRLSGGVGLRRGRRDPVHLRVGDAVDFWRVESVEPGRALRLRAEMLLPGRAWLDLSVEPEGAGSRYRQRAIFRPRGLLGHLYWWSISPFHGLIFGGMPRNLTATAEREAREGADRREPARV